MKSDVLNKLAWPLNLIKKLPWLTYVLFGAMLVLVVCSLTQLRPTFLLSKDSTVGIENSPQLEGVGLRASFNATQGSPALALGDSGQLAQGPQQQPQTPTPKPLSPKWQKIKEENARLVLTIGRTYSHLKTMSDNTPEYVPRDEDEDSHVDPHGEMEIPAVDAKPYTPSKSRRPLPYYRPPGEIPVRRYPQAIIIGFQRCGTRALLDFLSFHPYVKAVPGEVHFFDRDELFTNGYQWYLNQMPLSFSDQVTLERTSSYVYSLRSRDQIHRLDPRMKLMVVLRNPVDRLVSQKIARYGNTSVSEAVTHRRHLSLEDQQSVAVRMGIYHMHLAPWFQYFAWENIFIINGDELVEQPLKIMRKVESFLEIPALYESSNFVRHNQSGLYCYRGFSESRPTICHVKARVWRRPEMVGPTEALAAKFYKPHNDRLFKLIGSIANWTDA